MIQFISLFFVLEYICYDDGCHLRKFARNPCRSDITPTAKKLASLEIVIDKLHMTGHVDKWCLENCDPHLFSDLDGVSKLVFLCTCDHGCINISG